MNLKQKAYAAIKDRIMNCEYEPGAFLNEDILCTDLGMSRTPVREAVSRLEQENLLVILPKKGILITPVTIHGIHMVFECRLLMEPFIIANYCRDLPEEVLDELRTAILREEACTDQKMRDTYHWDNEFHECMQRQCTNIYVLKTLRDVHSQNNRMRVLSGRMEASRLQRTVGEHRAILEALEKNDAESAAERMREHLIRSREASLACLVNGQQVSVGL